MDGLNEIRTGLDGFGMGSRWFCDEFTTGSSLDRFGTGSGQVRERFETRSRHVRDAFGHVGTTRANKTKNSFCGPCRCGGGSPIAMHRLGPSQLPRAPRHGGGGGCKNTDVLAKKLQKSETQYRRKYPLATVLLFEHDNSASSALRVMWCASCALFSVLPICISVSLHPYLCLDSCRFVFIYVSICLHLRLSPSPSFISVSVSVSFFLSLFVSFSFPSRVFQLIVIIRFCEILFCFVCRAASCRR